MSTWVLLRGLTREARHWGDFPASLSAQLEASGHGPVRVVTPDFAGNGQQHGAPSATRVSEMAEQLRADLANAGYRPPYHVLALSLGAMAAVAWAYRHPDELARLVLMNTSMQPFSRFYQRLRPQNYLRLLALLAANPAAREHTILRITSNHVDPAQAAELLQNWQQFGVQAPVSASNALRQLLAALRFRADFAPPAVPLLMLASEQDQLVNVACSKQIAAHWHCPLRLHPTAGHDLPLDDGAWVAQQIGAWLAHG